MHKCCFIDADYTEQRTKVLTMKYGKQQMMLIRKRLRVEEWLMMQLEELFEDEVSITELSLFIIVIHRRCKAMHANRRA